ncbi:MAG: class I SAM-dependent methyltransferase [Rubrivivax sp.]
MTTTTAPSLSLPAGAPASARPVFALLRQLGTGTLHMQLPDGSQARFGSGGEPQAALRLHDWRVCTAALRSGDIGFAETFIDGGWSTPDLPALLRLFIANRQAVEQVIYGSWWGGLLYRMRHLLQRNSRRGSRRNIHAHYDIGNAFYRLWLDPTMNYSSALFGADRSQPMAAAQQAKIARALAECGVTGENGAAAGPRVLEIGCGWGALAEQACGLGAQVTGITLSTEQLDFARARLVTAGLAERAELRLQDYRDVADAPFDAVVSIEMFEAVGREYWGSFFETVAQRLKPGGRACIQTITIRDDLFERYTRSTDFIQQYIFPGGMLPSAQAFRLEAARAGLVVERELAFGTDYAETLRRWRAQFLAQDAQVRRLGFDTRFMRIWEFYLAYCEAAFDTGNTDVVQFTLRHA